MTPPSAGPPEWVEALAACTARLARLSGTAAPPREELEALADALWERHGALRPPGGWTVRETPEELDAAGVAAEQERIRAALARRGRAVPPLLEPHLRHLARLVAQPDFTRCRDSFRAATAGCIPARQKADVAAGRISGSHCVDCPHFVRLDAEENRALLLGAWHEGGRAALGEAWEVFLPEAFRDLRRVLHRARHGAGA